ncbi:hypothetical protein [Tabrizicola sp.]|uniref:hypothetical protein n=1 Tax=Tabrizicola sp. TaxID=2005166 RepID=UPI002FDD62FF
MVTGPALAEPPMTAAEFAAHVGTDTITYGYATGIVGIADYGPDQTLVWRYEGGACMKGRYHQSGDALCFSFEAQELSPCWHFGLQSGRLYGVTINLPVRDRIFEIGRSDRPLDCSDNETGV